MSLPCIAAFTARGAELAARLAPMLGAQSYAPKQHILPGMHELGDLEVWAEHAFQSAQALIFVGAAGIAVRAIAPHVRDKMLDPAVIVIDEMARYVIPILSGHVGGANKLAMDIAAMTGARPVITTATDLNAIPAFDTWAAGEHIAIENPKAIKAVASATLSGERVGVAITEREITPPFPVTLLLRPRTLTVGIGCRKNVDREPLEAGLMEFLKSCGVSMLSVEAFASIDLKAQEPALCYLSSKYGIPLKTFPAQALSAVPGEFASSTRVKAAVGVDNVCERAAVLCSGGRLLAGKTRYTGMTFALAGKDANL